MMRALSTRARRSVAIATTMIGMMSLGASAATAEAPSPVDDAPPSAEDIVSPEEIHSVETGDTLSFENPDASPAEAGLGAEGEAIVLRASGYTIACTPDAQNPHVSEGARKKGEIYVIYKTVVTCTGTGNPPATATIRVRGGLMWDSAKFAGDTSNGIKWSSLRSSEETRTVKVNGSKNTFYTPKSGLGGTFTGHYQGSSTVEIITPTGFKVGSDLSGAVFCKPTTKTAVCS